jgi:hypothetical protein
VLFSLLLANRFRCFAKANLLLGSAIDFDYSACLEQFSKIISENRTDARFSVGPGAYASPRVVFGGSRQAAAGRGRLGSPRLQPYHISETFYENRSRLKSSRACSIAPTVSANDRPAYALWQGPRGAANIVEIYLVFVLS